MQKVNNINKIKMFYELELNNNRICILDSNKNYFDDLALDYDGNVIEEEKAIREMLEKTDIEEMCNFFGTHKIINKEERKKYGSGYVNSFKRNNETIYVAFND